MRSFNKGLQTVCLIAATAGVTTLLLAATESNTSMKKWKQGVGWGWVWGADDEVGALNEMTDGSRLAATRLVTQGRVFDLGIAYDRTSYKWPGHSPGEIMSFRTPEGAKRQADLDFVPADGLKTAWHSSALFVNDNVATQIDSLCHATMGEDNHWYNGFKEADWGGDWGPRKCDVTTIPPVVARGVMIDVAAYKGRPALPSFYAITVDDLKGALEKQKLELLPGDVVLVRTGTLQFWGEAGAEHKLIDEHDSAGITLASAKWLVEQNGVMMIGSDTSGLEYKPSPDKAEAYA